MAEILIYKGSKSNCIGRLENGLVFDSPSSGRDENSSACVGHVDFNGYVYRKGRVSFSSHTPEHNDCVGRCERKYIYSDYRKNRDAGSVDLTTGEVYDSRGNSVGYVKTGSDFLMSCAAGALLLLLN